MDIGGNIVGLEAERAELLRRLEDVRSGRFVIGDEPFTRTPEDIAAHAASIEAAIAHVTHGIEVAKRQSQRDA